MKYIDADKLIAEINNRLMSVNLEKLRNFGCHRVWAYNDVKDIITSLQQEQPGADALVKMIWHKESDHPNNKHPYPVINPDGEMAFAYYDGIYGWQFDRDFPHSVNMMWLDIEMILPVKDND